VFPPSDLDVDVLVVVLVQGRHGARVADPEVRGVGAPAEGDAGKGDGEGHVGGKGTVFGG